MRSIRWLCLAGLAVGVLTAVALARAAWADNPVAPKGKETLKTDKSRTKVFRLTRTEPGEVKQVMDDLLDHIDPPPLPTPMPPVPAGGFGGIGGGGMPPSFAVAIDGRTKSLVVRGTEKHLAMAADLVAVLDHAPGKEPPEVKSLRAVVLKHAKPEELAGVLEALDLDVRVVALPAAKMLVFTGSETVMKDIADLIKDLDVTANSDGKKEDKRRLFEDGP